MGHPLTLSVQDAAKFHEPSYVADSKAAQAAAAGAIQGHTVVCVWGGYWGMQGNTGQTTRCAGGGSWCGGGGGGVAGGSVCLHGSSPTTLPIP